MSKQKKDNVLKEFKAFISKGSVLDLAVATIIGSAFGQIVSSFTNGIIMPLVSLLFSVEDLAKESIVLRPAVIDKVTEEIIKPAVTWQYGAFVQAVINFLIIALFLFILVKVIRSVQKSLNIDAQLTASVQKKLDNDEKLTDFEAKWLANKIKRDPENAPAKKPEPQPEPAPEPTPTEKMLAEIVDLLKKEQQ